MNMSSCWIFILYTLDDSKEHVPACVACRQLLWCPMGFHRAQFWAHSVFAISASLGSILRKPGILFHLYADDSQLYLPLKTERCLFSYASCVKPPWHQGADGQEWPRASWILMRKKQTTAFGPNGSRGPSTVDLGPLSSFFKSNCHQFQFYIGQWF